MWEEESQIEAFAELIEHSYEKYSTFLESIWEEYRETQSPNLALLFAFGKFSSNYMNRRNRTSGEEKRDSLHLALNETLKDPTVSKLVENLTAKASKQMFGGQ